MKSSEFKKVIKSAVKEAVREELKDILFEAFKSNTAKPSITENHSYMPPNVGTPTTNIASPIPSQPEMSLEDKRNAYKNILGETAASFTSNDVPQSFRPAPGSDNVNGNLGTGNVSMDQISSLLNK